MPVDPYHHWFLFDPSNFSRIRVSTATGLDSLPSEKATSSGTSINYIINAFGIGYTTSTLTNR